CERLREPLSVLREWEVPVEDRFAVGYVCRLLLRELLSMAARSGLGLLEVEGELRTEAGLVMLSIRLVEPTGGGQHLGQLAELQLERQTWSGGVVSVRWSALRVGRLEQVQRRWFGDDAETAGTARGFNNLVDRLSSRLRPQAVLRVEMRPDAQPECVA